MQSFASAWGPALESGKTGVYAWPILFPSLYLGPCTEGGNDSWEESSWRLVLGRLRGVRSKSLGSKPLSHVLVSHRTSLTKHKLKDEIIKNFKTVTKSVKNPNTVSHSKHGAPCDCLGHTPMKFTLPSAQVKLLAQITCVFVILINIDKLPWTKLYTLYKVTCSRSYH